LKPFEDVSIRVIVLTQSSKANVLNGNYENVPYETVMGDLLRLRMALLFPVLCLKARHALKLAYRPGWDNIIYNYGPLNLFNVGALFYAHDLGYKIVFDIVEDYDVAMVISRSLLHRTKMAVIQCLKWRIRHLASGIIVIGSHLKTKYRGLTHGATPIHYRAISVDFSCFAAAPRPFGQIVTLFYAGSFGKKDGLPVLLDAFDGVAARHANVRLALTGKGSDEMMHSTLARIDVSPFKDRIGYMGYLDDAAYYAELNAADILCATRIGSDYAQAGFPFKLGEFLATGKPVIASNVSDIANVLRDREEALLVEPGNPNSIENAVEYLLNNPEIASKIGKHGREKSHRLFDCRVQSQALLDFLRCL
jgi:glycosyltransferase involved in cell wall biosynthesis